MQDGEKVPAIRPALNVLRELDDQRFMDKLAVQIHDATAAVQAFGRPAQVKIVIDIAPLSKQHMTEQVVTFEAEITSKLPKPDGHRTLFYVDGDGNPTTSPVKQPGLNLEIAGRAAAEGGKSG